MAAGDDRTHTEARLGCLEHCALHRRTIVMTCPRCRSVRRFDAVALWWLFRRRGWNDGVPEARRRFHCAACRRSGRTSRPALEITREPPDADQPPYPDRATWNRLVSRYRS